MRVLFLSRWYPFPADNGARLRIFNLIKALSCEHEVSLVSFTSEPVAEERLQAMRTHCVQVQTVPYRAYQSGTLKAKFGALSLKPRSLADTDCAQMHALVASEAQRLKPHLVIASQIDMLPYARTIGTRRMIEELEVGIIHQEWEAAQGARKARAWLTWAKLNAYVRSISRDFHGCTVVSDKELQLVKPLIGDTPLHIAPNGVDVAACNAIRAMPAPDTLIYNGALTYGPNLDAVRYFVQEIFPLVLRERPATKLFVTGQFDEVPAGQLPRHDQLVLTGYVNDIRARVAGSWLAIAPIRHGGGTRLKILEALALRTPVVSTTKGAEGLGLVHDENVMLADDPQTFARCVVDVLADPLLRERLAGCGAQMVAERFDWRLIGHAFGQFASKVAGG